MTCAEKRGDRVGLAARPWLRGRHVQLLLDDGGAERGERDDQRDDLQLPRRAQQLERLGAADALFSRRSCCVGDAPAFAREHDGTTMTMQIARMAALTSSRLFGAERLGRASAVMPAPVSAAEAAPPPMKPNSRFACRAS